MTTVLEQFLQHLSHKDVGIGARANYRNNISHFMTWLAETTGQTDVATVTSFDIRAYRDKLKETYKPATINAKLISLSAFFRWCVLRGLSATDPTEYIKPVREQPRAPKWLSKQDIYKVLRTAREAVQMAQMKKIRPSLIIAVRTQAIVVLLVATGLRVSELCDLKLSDIRLSDKAGAVTVRWGKGAKRREIPLNADGRRAIRAWLAVRQNDSPYLFVVSGGRMSRQLVQFHLAELGRQSGVHLSPHLLRHTFGKSLIDAGESLDRVAALMGHSNLTTTAIYTMPGPSDLARAVDKIAWED